MITKTLILLLFYKIAYAQLNGEFWWLSDKVTKLKGVKPSLPKFEKLTEFDTDESAKITFIDEDAEEFNTVEEKLIREPKKFLNTESIYWPDGKSWNPTNLAPQMNTSPMKNSNNALNKANAPQKTKSEVLGDVFTFKFPNDDYFDKKYPIKADFIEDLTSRNKSSTVGHLKDKNETSDTNVNNKPEIQDLFIIQFPENGKAKNSKRPKGNFGIEPLKNKSAQSTETIDQLQSFNKDDMKDKNTRKSSHTEHICTYMKKSECNQKHGTIYFIKETPKKELIAQNICCILPLVSDGPHRIVFPDAFKLNHQRSRRSNKEESTIPSLKQRDFLLKQKFRPQNVRPTTQTKIVTPDYEDYVDPYWNIKSSSIKKPGSQSSIKQDCNYQDYVEDYTVELPRPGLVGIYSDSEQRPPWSFSNGNRPFYGSTADYSEEEDGTSFGYSTVDPRVSSQGPKRGKPIKLTTTQPEEVTFDIGSQTVSFQSSPNFQVLQGFKLLNLGRNKNKFYSKNTRRSTTEGVAENDSNEPEASHSALSEFNGTPELQIYDQCGKSIENTFIDNGDKDVGEAASGSHPWMALVVLTKRPQGILCYATIIHPKAAITAADCVYGRTSPREVSMLAGLWNLSDRSQAQNRVVSVLMHPQYRPKVLENSLALLQWRTPLKLNANVQPACLCNIQESDDCKFYGWGGFDQGIRSRSRWQRASILPADECVARFTNAVELPEDSICAVVKSRGTVTGLGGPLICNISGRKAVSGIAIWRDNVLIVLSAQEWILKAVPELNLE